MSEKIQWITEYPPTEADASFDKRVLCIHGGRVRANNYKFVADHNYAWLPLNFVENNYELFKRKTNV